MEYDNSKRKIELFDELNENIRNRHCYGYAIDERVDVLINFVIDLIVDLENEVKDLKKKINEIKYKTRE